MSLNALYCPFAAQGDSDLQLERVNVYFNEAGGGAFTILDTALWLPIV